MKVKLNIIRSLSKSVKEFTSFDKNIINYMMMHWCGGLLLIYASILPIYMYKMGINMQTGGLFFSVAALFDVVLTFIFSKFIDNISPNIAMFFDWITESIPPFIYCFAVTPIHLLLGVLVGNITNVLNSSYKVYENEIYPEKERSLIYTYHIITPEIFTVIFYPLIGYILTYQFSSLLSIKITFFICGAGYILVSLIPYKKLKWVEPFKLEKESSIISFSNNLYSIGFTEIMVRFGMNFTSFFITSYYILEKFNGSIFSVLLLEAIQSLIVLISGMISKSFIGKIREVKIAQYSMLFFILFALFMFLGQSYLTVVIAYIFKSIGNTLWFPNHNAILMRMIPKQRRGNFFATLDSINKLIYIITPLLSTFLVYKFNFKVVFIFSFILFFIAFMMYYKLNKDSKTVIKSNYFRVL